MGVADAAEQVRVDEHGVPAIEARVRHVDGKAEGGSESLRGKPRLVPRTARRVAAEVAGNDLGAPLVVQLRHSGRLDRHDGRVGGEVGDLGRAQLQELRAHLGGRQAGGQLASLCAGLATRVPSRGARNGLDRHAPAFRAAFDLVGRTQRGGGTYRGV